MLAFLLRCMGLKMALNASSLRCSNSVGNRRDFCRGDDAPGRRTIDPKEKLITRTLCIAAASLQDGSDHPRYDRKR